MTRQPSYSAHDFLRAAAQQRGELQAVIAECARLEEIHAGRRSDIAARASRALEELVVTLLPSMGEAPRARAAALTGYLPLIHPDVATSLTGERQWLSQRIAAIEADPRFAQRELLRAPRVGSLTRAIEELEQFRAPLVGVLVQAAHPRLERLLQVGYGTDAYQEKWWRSAYYADWEAADQIVERFPGKTFAEVRDEYLKTREAVDVYDARLAEIRREWTAGQALETEHARHSAALPTVDARHLQRARHALAQHIKDTDISALGQKLAADPDIEILAKRWHGLAHKLVYIDKIAETELGSLRGEAMHMLLKLDRDIAKYSRPKNAYAQIPGDVFERRFQGRRARYEKGFERFRTTYDTVHAFDRFDAANLAQNFLWWDLMTDGRIDGDFIPEVASFHGRHPGYRYQGERFDDDMDTAAAAVAAADYGFPDRRDRYVDAS